MLSRADKDFETYRVPPLNGLNLIVRAMEHYDIAVEDEDLGPEAE